MQHNIEKYAKLRRAPNSIKMLAFSRRLDRDVENVYFLVHGKTQALWRESGVEGYTYPRLPPLSL